MKHLTFLTLFALHSSLFALHAGVPLRWTVETTRVQPATFDVVRGETIALEASFNNAGKPFAMDGYDCSIFWQTNGMGSAWWTAPAAAASNRVSATFTPEMDPGASTVIGFLGSTGQIYRASFQLRFRHGPGATPNALPLPQPVIDFARVRVLNPPWGAGVVDTNAVIDIILEQLETKGIRSFDGADRPLPKYLWLYEADDSYPDDAAWYYAQPQDYGQCSAMRDGGFLYRNYDWKFDDAAEFVVKVSQGPSRFASVGVANCGTNLTESFVTSGKPSRYYKCLPGRVVDGINENGVVCEVNVVDGSPQTSGWHTTGDIHPLAAVRWSLDNGTSAGMVASNLASRIAFPQGWAQNFHWMVADESQTWIVENGTASNVTGRAVMTNFSMFETWAAGGGMERYNILVGGEPITNAWFTRAYSRQTYWISDFRDAAEMEAAKTAWETHAREELRGKGMWQSVHTSVYDITNRTLRVAVQETDDWYTFAVQSSGVSPVQARAIAAEVVAPVAAEVRQKIGGNEVPDHETDPTVPDWAKADAPPSETDPTVPDWAKTEYPFHIYSGGGAEVFTDGNDVYIYGANVFHGNIPMIDNTILMEVLRDYIEKDPEHQTGNIPVFSTDGGLADSGFTTDDITGKADRAELTAATNEVIHVIKDAAKNLKYTITGDNGRFYMTPIGAINPED